MFMVNERLSKRTVGTPLL